MLKKFGWILVLMPFLAFSLGAEEPVLWGSQYSPGNFLFQATAALESDSGTDERQIALYPQAEMVLFKPQFGSLAFWDLGAAVKGRVGIPMGGGAPFTVGVAPCATFHFGFRGFDFTGAEYLEKLDLYGEFGISFDFLDSDDPMKVGFTLSSGAAYFINDSLAIKAGYTDWGWMQGISLGVSLRFGGKPPVKGFAPFVSDVMGSLDALAAEMYLTQFYLYYLSFYTLGGYYFDDGGYEVGTGTLWRITDLAEGDSFTLEKALLEEGEGFRWWKMAVSDGEERWVYEFQVDGRGYLQAARFRDEDGVVQSVVIDEETRSRYETAPLRVLTEEEAEEWRIREEKVTVEAGSFIAEIFEHRILEEDLLWSWWISPEVPGMSVKYIYRYGEEGTEGELIRITRDNRSELR